ncbi:MAG: N-acetylmuramoyl-L-alanine amidase, partial [Synergistaceae bacterium]|nr:N-acetylmuramoyl-L-alanine amidase [Synergistaceae bacterium]
MLVIDRLKTGKIIKPLCRSARSGLLVLLTAFLFAFITHQAAVVSAEEMDLIQGDVRKGSVSVIERDGVKFAALDQILSSLGLAPSAVSGGLVSTFSEKKIEFWSGSNVARVNGSVFPMPAVVFFENDHWWGEANSSLHAMKQFLSSIQRPSDIAWRAAGTGVQPAAVPAAPRAGGGAKPPLAPTPPSSTPGRLDSVFVSRVRWGEQVDAHRAVIDISAQTGVELKEYPDRVDVVFSGASTQQFTENSPWSPLSVNASQSSGNVVLSFRHAASRVKSFWVLDPPRYVVDFYFGGAAATPASPPAGQTPAINTTPGSPPSRGGKFLVVVDAGHGGHDPGAVGNNLREKDINLKAAHELSDSLKKLGLDVKLTRGDDRYLKLGERTAFANSARADVFVSLHCNALPKGQHASGVEFYLMDQPTDRAAFNLAVLENRELDGSVPSNEADDSASDQKTQLLMKILIDMQQNDKLNESTTLAEFLYNRARGAGFSLRKVRQAPLFVLRGAEMPALLVEMGYITEAKDVANLNSQTYRQKLMDAV